MNDPILEEQIEYYRARAREYDQSLAQATDLLAPGKILLLNLGKFDSILELACGTGIWTEQLLRFSSQITALDGSSEMLAINAARVRSPGIRYVESDLFEWKPFEKFDVVFFGFWLSHVPPEKFDRFWQLVATSLAPGRRFFFVDSRKEQTSTAVDHQLPSRGTPIMRRRLNDGREFQIYKVFYEPTELVSRLQSLGWTVQLDETEHYFLHGHGHLR